MKHISSAPPFGRFQALAENFRLGWKLRAVADTLAYYDTVTITAVKSFITDPNTVKPFTVVIYSVLLLVELLYST